MRLTRHYETPVNHFNLPGDFGQWREPGNGSAGILPAKLSQTRVHAGWKPALPAMPQMQASQINFERSDPFRILNPTPRRERAGIQFMKPLLILIAGAWLLAGCASYNVNPPVARADTGYVDLYTIAGEDLNWEVARCAAHAQKYRVIFSEFKPLPEGVLRLAFPPGKYRLRVTFLNCVIREPSGFEVEVAAGMVTPVHVVLTDDGVTLVQSKELKASRSVKGGRQASYNTDESTRYRISTVVNAPVPYRVKEQMPYAH